MRNMSFNTLINRSHLILASRRLVTHKGFMTMTRTLNMIMSALLHNCYIFWNNFMNLIRFISDPALKKVFYRAAFEDIINM